MEGVRCAALQRANYAGFQASGNVTPHGLDDRFAEDDWTLVVACLGRATAVRASQIACSDRFLDRPASLYEPLIHAFCRLSSPLQQSKATNRPTIVYCTLICSDQEAFANKQQSKVQ